MNSRTRKITQRTLGAISLGLTAVATAPIFIPYAALTKLTGQTVFFKQTRYTKDKKPFEVWKLRTLDDDGKVTLVGKFLKSTSLDELPQLINVAKGEMDLVGPRPLMIHPDNYEAALKEANLPLAVQAHEDRYKVNAGISCFFQVSRLRTKADMGVNDLALMFYKDQLYTKFRKKGHTMSAFTDAAVMAATIPALLLNRGATERKNPSQISPS